MAGSLYGEWLLQECHEAYNVIIVRQRGDYISCDGWRDSVTHLFADISLPEAEDNRKVLVGSPTHCLMRA